MNQPMNSRTVVPTTMNQNRPSKTTVSMKKTTDQRRQEKETHAIQAIDLAKSNVDLALDYMQEHLPWEFLHHFTW